ncbi:hypothetical protein C7S18_02675 [Ahniella affigens]|uniref:Pilus assembly protein PilW n=1 Tax=Ahniella affigens TaxID=2021234 RepID=A0A2P1PMT8_9GAMM|nr:PilW family protein [Ahniella affigens]AVP96164.1 hypothetical protein C7S18_02675 [Ahniella affigens]
MKPIRPHNGFSLIELMIAMTLGVLVIFALTQLVARTTRSNTTQQSLQRLQENGRFAMSRIVGDLRMTGAQYCATLANIAPVGRNNRHRALMVYADGGMLYGFPTRAAIKGLQPVADAEPYPISTRFFMQGHECTTNSACVPALNVLGGATPTPPAAGTAAGNRAAGADVLTVRYLAAPGVPIGADYAGGPAAIALNNTYTTNATAGTLAFVAGDLAMISDCNNAQVFEAAAAGVAITPNDTTDDSPTAHNDISAFTRGADSRVFNFTRNFITSTYYLQIRNDSTTPGRRISSLVRQVNGNAQIIADGVERLEFRYAIEDVNGQTRYLTAEQVQGMNTALCQPFPVGVRAMEPGCGWRSVVAIDVSLLMNSVDNNAPSETERYSFTFDNQIEVAPPGTLPSGLPRGRLFRREFRTTVTVRNFGI